MEFPLPEDNVPGNNPATNATQASGSKRSLGDLGDEDDNSDSKKARVHLEEATKMILEFQQSFEEFKNDLASSQNDLEKVKAEIEKWETAFEKESFVPSGKKPEPKFVVDYIQTLRASETSLKEQVEIAQMKLAIRDLKDELKFKQESEKKVEEMVEKSESDGDQHHAMHLEILDLKSQLTKTEATLNTFVTSIGLLLRAKGIDPTSLLPTTVINSGVEAARDTGSVRCSSTSAGGASL